MSMEEWWATKLTRSHELAMFAARLDDDEYDAASQLAEAFVTLGYKVTFEPLTRESPNDGVSARIVRAEIIAGVGSGDTIEEALADLTRKIIADGGLPA